MAGLAFTRLHLQRGRRLQRVRQRFRRAPLGLATLPAARPALLQESRLQGRCGVAAKGGAI